MSIRELFEKLTFEKSTKYSDKCPRYNSNKVINIMDNDYFCQECTLSYNTEENALVVYCDKCEMCGCNGQLVWYNNFKVCKYCVDEQQ